MKNTVFALVVLLSTVTASFAASPLLMVNEDNDHYFKLAPELMTKEALRAYIDQFAETRVTHFLMCPNGQRTSYRSAVHESIWDNIDRYENPNIWSRNCKTLFDRGIDPYAVWIDRCREKGIVPWLTMRMNDVHFVTTPDYFRNTDHWRDHPQWWRVPYTKGNNWMNYAYDYSHPEVRAYHLALVRELLERYDVDGFEMDWMRFGYHLTDGKMAEQAPILTGFVRQVHELVQASAKKRGHAITVSARVCSDPTAARSLGMDAVEWAKRGLVDCLVVSSFYTATDHATSVRLWRDEIGSAADKMLILPSIDDGGSAGPTCDRIGADPATITGWANEMHWLGADSLYLFNFVYMPITKPEWREIMEKGLDRDAVTARAQHHPIGWRDCGVGGKGANIQLPKKTDGEVTLAIQIGYKPTKGTAAFVLGMAKGPGVADAVFELEVNGTAVVKPENAEWPGAKRYAEKFGRVLKWSVPLDALIDGVNTVKIRQTAGETQKIIWAELDSFPGST